MRIGFTGHRPNRLRIGKERVAARLREVLGLCKAAAIGRDAAEPLIALSSLAEGSDRLFAEEALGLEIRLEALLPFSSADYERTFGDAGTIPQYRSLLSRASSVEELQGSLTATKAAYEAVGCAMVERSDILVAVWDGEPAAGRGGTPEIISYALEQRRPVILIDAAKDARPRLLPAGRGLKPDPIALRSRARLLEQDAIVRLLGKRKRQGGRSGSA